MIKIIKEGTKHKCKCEECGCLFSYEDEDIQLFSSLPYTNVDFCSYEYIKCPQCKNEIELTKGIVDNKIGEL